MSTNFYQIFAGFRAVKVGGGRHHNCPPSSVTRIRGGDGVRFKKKFRHYSLWKYCGLFLSQLSSISNISLFWMESSDLL